MKRARGFTLLELVVASVMILAITGVSLSVMLTVHFTQIESQIRNATTRDAQLILDTIGEDLRYLGAGVPYGANVQTAIGGVLNPAIQLRPALRVAQRDYLAFVGDLPYPNADFNGIASLSDITGTAAADDDDEFAISSELSGCVPPAAGGAVSCDTRVMSPAWNGLGPVACTSAALTAATCPWALNKWQRAPDPTSDYVDLVVGAPTGVWALVRWNMTSTKNIRDQVVIHADHDYPASGAHDLQRQPFVDARAGNAMVAQLDRVFYSLEKNGSTDLCDGTDNCVLKRRQCWGALGSPSFNNFPAAGVDSNGPGRSGGDPGNCVAGVNANGTRWEPVTGGISGSKLDALGNVTPLFRYFNDAGVELDPELNVPKALTRAQLETVASIEATVTVKRQARIAFAPGAPPKTLTQTMSRRYYLQNYGPWVNSWDCTSAVPAVASNCTFLGNP